MVLKLVTVSRGKLPFTSCFKTTLINYLNHSHEKRALYFFGLSLVSSSVLAVIYVKNANDYSSVYINHTVFC